MKAILLAGGFAKRLWPLTTDKAKPLLPLAGKPVLSHILDRIPEDVPVIVSTNTFFKEDFLIWQQQNPNRDIDIFIEDSQSQQTKKGALAAIELVMDFYQIKEDILVIAGDNYFQDELDTFLDLCKKGDPVIAVYDLQDKEQAKKFGVVIEEDGMVSGFEEKPAEPKSTLIGTGCYYFPLRTHDVLRRACDALPDTLGGGVQYLHEQGISVRVHHMQGYWNDIGSFRAYVEAHMHAGEQPIPAEHLHDEQGNTFEGVNYIEDGCLIERSNIKDSIVLSGAVIREASIDQCVVDREYTIQGDSKRECILSDQTKDPSL